jgi:Ca2+-binding RTX toxin-like protein
LATLAVLTTGLFAAPGALGASEVSGFFGSLSFQAGAGVANDLTVAASSSTVTFSDPQDTINESLANCAGSGTNTVVCVAGVSEEFFGVNVTLDEFTADANNDSLTVSGSLRVSGSGVEGNDTLSSSGTGRFEASGGAGNDIVTGGSGDDSLSGDEGTDTVNGNGGIDGVQGGEGAGDVVNGGAGSDVFIATAGDGGADQLNGDAGQDLLLLLALGGGPPPAFVVDLAGGSVSSGGETDALGSMDDAVTFQGGDTVTGTAEANRIITALDEEPVLAGVGGIGAELPVDAGDTVDPLGGSDYVITGDGNDVANLVDGSADKLECGSGTDVVQADQLDTLVECETVTVTNVTPVGSAPLDTAKPRCTLKGVAKSYRRKAFLRGLRAKVSCNEPVTLEAELTTRASAKGKRSQHASISRAGDLVLAESFSGAKTAATLTLRPAVPRALLPASFRATLRIVARDAAGNATVLQRSIRVKPDRKKKS